MPSSRHLLPAAVAAAALALPAAAGAAQTVGSSLDASRGPATSIACHGCSVAVHEVDGLQTWTDEGIVTSFSAKLEAGTTAKLRVFDRQGASRFVPTAESAAVTGTGGVSTFPVSVPVRSSQTIGLVLDGRVAAIAGTGRAGIFTGDADASFEDVEPMLQASVESDYDGDGLGDETQDPCLFDCGGGSSGGGGGGGDTGGGSTGGGSGGSGGSGGDVLPPAGGGSGGNGGGGGSAKTGSFRSNENIRSRTQFTIQDTGLVVSTGKPTVTAYVYNGHNDAMTGKATLKVGGKVVAKAKVWVSTQDDVEFAVTPKVAKAIAKGAKATVSATVSNDENGTERDSFAPRFLKPVTTKYDGKYRAKGPIVIEVRDGVVRTATSELLAMSTQGSGSMLRSFYLPDGIPAIIGKDGKVEVHGHWASDEMRFKAEFGKDRIKKGYISLWHYEMGFSSGGRFVSKPYLGASNWTAKKVGK